MVHAPSKSAHAKAQSNWMELIFRLSTSALHQQPTVIVVIK
jgi:hypothetical protein